MTTLATANLFVSDKCYADQAPEFGCACEDRPRSVQGKYGLPKPFQALLVRGFYG